MPLDVHARKVLGLLAAGGPSDIAELTPQQMRDAFARLTRAIDSRDEPVESVREGSLPGPGCTLPYRLYRTRGSGNAPAPGVIYFHGGGCVFGSIDTHDGLCRRLADSSACAVVSVGYRQAPEHRFPAAVDDAQAAAAWIFTHAADLGLDADRIALAGDSAGGGLAVAACLALVAEGTFTPALQVLFCPVMDLTSDSASRQRLGAGYFLDRATIDWMIGHYCPPGTDLADWRLSPGLARGMVGLPPAHIHTAEFDPLRDEGEAYARSLRIAGVEAAYTCHPGMIHHFYGMAAAIPYARTAMLSAGAAIRAALRASTSPPARNARRVPASESAVHVC